MVDSERLVRAVEAAKKIDGWMTESELYWLAQQALKYTRIIEVGSWLGRSTKALAMSTDGQVLAVDHFDGDAEHIWGEKTRKYTRETLSNRFVENLLPELQAGRVMKLVLDSVRAAGEVLYSFPKGVDFIFLDGGHSYEQVLADIDAYLPLLQPGGLLAGHDYQYPPVRQAVAERLPNAKVAVDNIWCWYKPAQ